MCVHVVFGTIAYHRLYSCQFQATFQPGEGLVVSDSNAGPYLFATSHFFFRNSAKSVATIVLLRHTSGHARQAYLWSDV